jgi:hypothetical protein
MENGVLGQYSVSAAQAMAGAATVEVDILTFFLPNPSPRDWRENVNARMSE